MRSSCPPLLVFTDLDGCLLDHFSYSYADALPALDELKTSEIPLILTSSKTFAELAELSTELEVSAPFIVENGAGVILPDGYFSTAAEGLVRFNGCRLKSFGPGHSGIIKILHQIRDDNGFRFSGFSDMSVTEIADLTGLSEARAGLARKRLFTEPILWQDSEIKWQAFSSLLADSGLSHLRGGRFVHITGGGDKGIALNWLRDCYKNRAGEMPKVMALGDSDNDIGMLEQADYPVIVRSPVHAPPVVTARTAVIFTQKTGPAGWNDAVLERLQKFRNSRK